LLLALGAGGGVISVVVSGLSTSFRHARNSEPAACTSVNLIHGSIQFASVGKQNSLKKQQIDRDGKENESIDMEKRSIRKAQSSSYLFGGR